MVAMSKTYNKHEMLFGLEPTDFSKLNDLVKNFSPYKSLWNIVNFWMVNFPLWMQLDWEQVDAGKAEKFVEEDVKQFNQAFKNLRLKAVRSKTEGQFKPLLEMAEVIKKEINEFKKKVPLLVALKREGIKDRHWNEIISRTGVKLKISEHMNFEYLLNNDLLLHN